MPIHQPNKQIEELQQKVLLLEKENRKLHIKNQERINTEKALKESVEKHKLLFESLGDGIAYYDLSGRVILINEKGARNLGGIPADFVDKSLRDFLDHEMADLLLERLDRTITSGKSTEQYDYLELPPGGMYLSSTFHPVRDAGNKIIGVQIISKDVSQQKLAEEELLKSEQRFQYAMEATQDGLYDWNLVTNEIYYSPGWKRMLGYEVDELPDDFSVWETLTDPEDVKRSWEMQQELVNKERERFEMEFKMKHKDGHWVDILSRASAIFDENGEAVRIVGTHVDITERKQFETELKNHREHLEELVNERTEKLNILVQSMAGREVRMAELKKVIKKLRAQLEGEGMTPVANDPLLDF